MLVLPEIVINGDGRVLYVRIFLVKPMLTGTRPGVGFSRDVGRTLRALRGLGGPDRPCGARPGTADCHLVAQSGRNPRGAGRIGAALIRAASGAGSGAHWG